ncbi:MAG: BACON domain-containing protein [bacterium]|nr:BACON domain-containing protein [bacterium]
MRVFKILVISVVFVAAFIGFAGEDGIGNRAGTITKALLPPPQLVVNRNFGKVPLYFVANKGQVNKQARFYAQTPGYTLWVTTEGLVFDVLTEKQTLADRPGKTGNFGRKPHHMKKDNRHIGSAPPGRTEKRPLVRDVSRLTFPGGNKNPVILPLEPAAYKVNVFLGNDRSAWRRGIPSSKAVVYKKIFRHIDLKVYGLENQVEYDWLVHPGGDPGRIRFQYHNTVPVRLDKDGNLRIKTACGDLIHNKPVTYQEIGGRRVPVASRFKKYGKNLYGFYVGEYNKNIPLVIDPPVTLEYATYFGGSRFEEGIVRIDAAGNIYIGMETQSSNYPTLNAYKTSLSGYCDFCVTKLNADGSELIFSTYFGGGSSEYLGRIALRPDGGIYIFGNTGSTNITAYGSHQGGGWDIIIGLFSADGDFLAARYIGGSGAEYAEAGCYDTGRELFCLTGNTGSSNFPVNNAYQPSRGGGTDGFVAVFSEDLSEHIYGTYMGGSSNDRSHQIFVDNAGYIYISGRTASGNFPVQNAWQPVHGGGDDGFIAKLHPDCSDVVFSSYLGGGNSNEFARVYTLDENGNIIASVLTQGNDLPVLNPYQAGNNGGWETYIAIFDPNMTELLYATYFGGSGEDSFNVLPGGSGNLFIGGSTTSSQLPVLNPVQASHAGGYDGYLALLDSEAGELVFATYYGGSGNERYLDLVKDDRGNAYLCDRTSSRDLPLQNPYQSSYGGGEYDFFVAKFSYGLTLTVQSTPYTGAPITIRPEDQNGDGNGDTNFTRLYQMGTVVELEAPEVFRGDHFYRWLIDGTADPRRSISLTMDTLHTAVADYGLPAEIELDKTALNFSIDAFNASSASDTFAVSNTGEKGLDWRVADDAAWMTCSPDRGTDTGQVTVTVDTSGLSAGTYSGTITVSAAGALNSPQTIQVTLNVYFTCNLTVQSTPQSGVSIEVAPADTTGQGNGSTPFTRNYNAGTTVTLTAPATAGGLVFHKWTIGDNQYTEPTTTININTTATATAVYRTPAEIIINRTRLNFGGIGTLATGTQTFLIDNAGEAPLNWTVNCDASWLSCTPKQGEDFGEIAVTVDGTALAPGTYSHSISVSAEGAVNSPQTLPVYFVVYESGAPSIPPFGSWDTPADNAVVSGSVSFGGWALDNIDTMYVKLYRKEGSNWVYLGEAVFVEDARPDVEEIYSNFPRSYRAGWGYMLLTHFLPENGNGSFTLRVKAFDKEGNATVLGTRTLVCNNKDAVRPFGAIDTPAPGATVSGSDVKNNGWVLTPPPNKIPEDGKTIMVWVDGANVGNPVYNLFREDIAALFPDYANSGGAGAKFHMDTTTYDDGMHTIAWIAVDSAGNVDGIGSRYFTIRNRGLQRTGKQNKTMRLAALSRLPGKTKGLHDISLRPEAVAVKKGFDSNRDAVFHSPGKNGNIDVSIKETEPVHINLNTGAKAGTEYWAYALRGHKQVVLPVGSRFDSASGVFHWQPGPGFIGRYSFLFLERRRKGKIVKCLVTIQIGRPPLLVR